MKTLSVIHDLNFEHYPETGALSASEPKMLMVGFMNTFHSTMKRPLVKAHSHFNYQDLHSASYLQCPSLISRFKHHPPAELTVSLLCEGFSWIAPRTVSRTGSDDAKLEPLLEKTLLREVLYCIVFYFICRWRLVSHESYSVSQLLVLDWDGKGEGTGTPAFQMNWGGSGAAGFGVATTAGDQWLGVGGGGSTWTVGTTVNFGIMKGDGDPSQLVV